MENSTVETTKDLKVYPGKIIPTKNAGRPLKLKSALALKKRIDKYFSDCDKNEIPYTMSGLALSLGISRATLKNYETKEFYGFGNLIEIAKTRIENYMETQLFAKKQCVGAIFALKNNFDGWVEKSETKIKGPLGDILDTIQNAKTKSFITKRS